ncbi:MAG TPA: hypothetical protein ENG40_03310 [Thermoprotei archaeon]|nr:hypothetical protein [Thermoprotei archaeon]
MKKLGNKFFIIWYVWTIYCFIISLGLIRIGEIEFLKELRTWDIPEGMVLNVIPIHPLWYSFALAVLFGGQIPFLLYEKYWCENGVYSRAKE